MKVYALTVRKPFFEHDCDDCIWCGSYVSTASDDSAGVVDVYVHRASSGLDHTIVRRFSSDAPDYSSFLMSIVKMMADKSSPTTRLEWEHSLKLVHEKLSSLV